MTTLRILGYRSVPILRSGVSVYVRANGEKNSCQTNLNINRTHRRRAHTIGTQRQPNARNLNSRRSPLTLHCAGPLCIGLAVAFSTQLANSCLELNSIQIAVTWPSTETKEKNYCVGQTRNDTSRAGRHTLQGENGRSSGTNMNKCSQVVGLYSNKLRFSRLRAQDLFALIVRLPGSAWLACIARNPIDRSLSTSRAPVAATHNFMR